MARPAVYNADYFTHKASMRNDRRIKAIRARMGAAGYGLLMMLLEVLTDADHTQLSTDELELELLAGDLGVSVTEINSLLQICEKVGYFSRSEDGMLVCPDLSKALEPVFDKRNRSRATANSGRNPQNDAEIPVSATETIESVTETPQSKEEESRVKESNNSIPVSDETDDQDSTEGDGKKTPVKTNYPGEFEVFWKQYAKPTGSKKDAYTQWKKLKPEGKEKVMDILPNYLMHQPEAVYRKDADRFLKSRLWESDFTPGSLVSGQKKQMVY